MAGDFGAVVLNSFCKKNNKEWTAFMIYQEDYRYLSVI
jgi:hypothetical protein